MAKLPLTSKKLNLARLCATAWLTNLGCTRKCFWHLFSEPGQQPEEFGLCLPCLHKENSSMRACTGPICQHTIHPASWPPEKDMVTTDHPPLSPVPCWLCGCCHWQWPERKPPPRTFQMETGCHEDNGLAETSSWAIVWARQLLEARVYSRCWIQARHESRFQPTFTHMLCSKSCFPQTQHS